MAIDIYNKAPEESASTSNKMKGGADGIKKNTDYRANSNDTAFGVSRADVISAVPSLSDIPAYRAASNVISVANQVYQTTLKITLSEIGFWKQVLSYSGNAETSDFGKSTARQQANLTRMSAKEYRAIPELINRQDTQNEFVFRCGDYFLPLSFTYTLQASKNMAISQLVDGVEIIQQVNRKPKDITVNMRIERNINRINTTNSAANMAFINANAQGINQKDNIDGSDIELEQIKYQVSSLGIALNDLYENQEVFQIENRAINTDMGISWVMMDSFSYKVNDGSSIVDIEMKLHEVNMDENAVVFRQSTVNSTSSAGGGTKR